MTGFAGTRYGLESSGDSRFIAGFSGENQVSGGVFSVFCESAELVPFCPDFGSCLSVSGARIFGEEIKHDGGPFGDFVSVFGDGSCIIFRYGGADCFECFGVALESHFSFSDDIGGSDRGHHHEDSNNKASGYFFHGVLDSLF